MGNNWNGNAIHEFHVQFCLCLPEEGCLVLNQTKEVEKEEEEITSRKKISSTGVAFLSPYSKVYFLSFFFFLQKKFPPNFNIHF